MDSYIIRFYINLSTQNCHIKKKVEKSIAVKALTVK